MITPLISTPYTVNVIHFRTNGNGELLVKAEFPGLPVEYTINSDDNWQEFSSPVILGAGTNNIQLRTKYVHFYRTCYPKPDQNITK